MNKTGRRRSMQIALTKKLSNAMEQKPPASDEAINPLFTWTANWTKVWDNRRTEDMLVLVNNATRFTVAVYQVKRKDLKNVAEKMKAAIKNTLLYLSLNPELVDVYMRLAGEVTFVRNSNRKAASWVTKAGLECVFSVGREYNGIDKMYSDTVGASANYRTVNCSDNNDGFQPNEAMVAALTELTGMQAYKNRAFELMVTLDLEVYKAKRRIIVPVNMEFYKLHKVFQEIFDWRNYHLYDFTIFDDETKKTLVRMVPFEEDLAYDKSAVLMKGHTLTEYLPEHKQIIYRYDIGDNWKHEIQLVRVIEEYDGELPYLLEAKGQTPPEDVGGVGGFVSFREIMLNPNHPEHMAMKEWAGYWTPELREWHSRPRVIHLWW